MHKLYDFITDASVAFMMRTHGVFVRGCTCFHCIGYT